LYPEHTWKEVIPAGHWKDVVNQRRFFDKLGITLGIKNLDDWSNVAVKTVLSHQGSSFIVAYYGSSLMRGINLLLTVGDSIGNLMCSTLNHQLYNGVAESSIESLT
jgi:hypothetical protein